MSAFSYLYTETAQYQVILALEERCELLSEAVDRALVERDEARERVAVVEADYAAACEQIIALQDERAVLSAQLLAADGGNYL